MTRTDGSPSSVPAPASMSEAFDWRSLRTWAVFLGFAIAFGATVAAIEMGLVFLFENVLQFRIHQVFRGFVMLAALLAVCFGLTRVVRGHRAAQVSSAVSSPPDHGFTWLQRPQDYLLYSICCLVIVIVGTIKAQFLLAPLGLDPERVNPGHGMALLWTISIFSPYFFIPLLKRFAAKRPRTS